MCGHIRRPVTLIISLIDNGVKFFLQHRRPIFAPGISGLFCPLSVDGEQTLRALHCGVVRGSPFGNEFERVLGHGEKEGEDELQKVTDKWVKKVDEVIAAKEKDILTV